MDDTLQAQIEAYLAQLLGLIQRGLQIRDALASNPSDASALLTNRIWQQDCGVTINQLSGGSKSHWLARAFSQAFLLRTAGGRALEGAAPHEIVQRLLEVLEQAIASLSRTDDTFVHSAASQPVPRRFDFVSNSDLRPVVEQAYNDSRSALEEGRYDEALRTACGILEAIVTDALEQKGVDALAKAGAPAGNIADWPFETRLTVAEKAGLLRGGWVRLPAAARKYREHDEDTPTTTVSEREARQAAQVLHVVMRDLNPGR
jgi:hypothetical protein